MPSFAPTNLCLLFVAGVSALAVHTRRRHDRPRHWAQWDQLPLLRGVVGELPLIANGDVFSPDDIPRAYEWTGADSLMLARGAMWNASLFRGEGRELAPQSEMVQRYVELCEQTDNPFGNSKYVVMQAREHTMVITTTSSSHHRIISPLRRIRCT